MRQIQHGVTQEHHQFFVLPIERAGKWLIACFRYDAFPDPLPKLCLRSPKLFSIAADDQRCSLLLLFLLVFVFLAHNDRLLNTPVPLRGSYQLAKVEAGRSHT